MLRTLIWLLLIILATPAVSPAERDTVDLTELTLEELLEIEVTLASRKSETLTRAAAAIYVLTREDIRRSGATSIPEALRMVPGLQVAQIDASKWAVSIRGFTAQFANKLLVLIDGRSIYTPLFSGVFWDAHDVLLEEVERIEIIRGPGAALWGANAVNGIINIVTRHASASRGSLVTGGGGVEERAFGNLRHGGTLGEATFYRIYAKYFKRDGTADALGREVADGWNAVRGGFRIDHDSPEGNALTLQGEFYDGNVGQAIVRAPASLSPPYTLTFNNEIGISGGHVLGRWTRRFSETSDLSWQLYYDLATRGDRVNGSETRHTFDLDFQHRFGLGRRQEIVWGVGYRSTSDAFENTFAISLSPDSRTDHLLSAFLQNDIGLVVDRLRLTLGSKLERHTTTGLEIQPNLRLLWTPSEKQTVWAAASRAVRTPSRFETDGEVVVQIVPPDSAFAGSPVGMLTVSGSRNLLPEELFAFELGYRTRPTDRLFLDLATFYNFYTHLRTVEPGELALETLPPRPTWSSPVSWTIKWRERPSG